MSYTEAQLRQFASQSESHWLERKESFSQRDKVCQTVCAFANDLARSGKAGVIFLDIRDSGEIIGIRVDDLLLQGVDQITSDARIQPLPSVTVQTLEISGKAVVALVVMPSTLPPVRFDGRIWVRMGVSNRQQLFRNAILHRQYEGTNAPVRVYVFDDRIEISNPGGPYGIVTKENFGQPHITDYRNPTIADALKNLGFVQQFGFGIQHARTSLRANGNPAPEFTVGQSHVLVTIRKRGS
jgi:predicted HTH transcriptional regulator